MSDRNDITTTIPYNVIYRPVYLTSDSQALGGFIPVRLAKQLRECGKELVPVSTLDENPSTVGCAVLCGTCKGPANADHPWVTSARPYCATCQLVFCSVRCVVEHVEAIHDDNKEAI